ncbi:probable cell division cycle-associated protein 7 at N-terminal half [Coccomyxa sp. Obi]|nr:probable cell division cycle-associated protein 7 at N-terminal half [Coccomyxa sp. Obi]
MSRPGRGLCHEVLAPYEIEREERIQRNKQILEEMGIIKQVTLLEAGLRSRKPGTSSNLRKAQKKVQSCPSTPLTRRSSSRIANKPPENTGLTGDEHESHGRLVVAESVIDPAHEQRWSEYVSKHRCDSQSRGSVYDSKAGICCHFCRQKKLCGEMDCRRCSERNPELPCLGKSECTRCGSATGRFCRACLLVRYGMTLEAVREEMEAGTWLCPHCYEDDHPDEGWICNSSICMTKRGLKPTGIAIYDAQQKGFASVAHYVQAQQLARSGKKLAAVPKPAPAVKVQKKEVKLMAKPAEQHAEISKGQPIGGGPEAPGAAGAAAARDGSGAASPQASSEATVVLVDLAGDQDAESADACASMARAAGKEIVDAADPAARRPAAHTPVKRRLPANLPASEGRLTRRQGKEMLQVTPADQLEKIAAAPCARITCSRRRLIT